METVLPRRFTPVPLLAAALLAAFVFSGCPPLPPPPPEEYTGDAYLIGNLAGVLIEELSQTFVNLIPYDGASVDAPIFIAADCIESLSETEQQGVLDTFNSFRPIVVVQAGEEEINALLALLGLDQNSVLPEDKAYAELFGVDQEEEGYVFAWVTYPPDQDTSPFGNPDDQLEDYTDDSNDQLERVELLSGWIADDGERLTPEVREYRKGAAEALETAVKAEGAELTQLAQGFVTTVNFQKLNNNYQLSYYVYSCHSFNAADATDYDWFYVRQEGMLNAAGGYEGVLHWYKGSPSAACGVYTHNYKMNNWVDTPGVPASAMALMKASPQNANDVAQVTSGVDWNVGGSVGFQGFSLAGALTGGVSVHNSTTFNVSDCEVTNNSGDAVNNAKWQYEFKPCEQIVYFAYTSLAEPPSLARANFQPVNQWVWKFAPSVRNSNVTGFQSQLTVDVYCSHGGQPYSFWIADPPRHDSGTMQWTCSVPLSFPPLLVAPHNLDFSAAAQYKTIDIAVSRDWKAASNQPWCRIDPVAGSGANTRVNIIVDANNTGASHAATIVFETADGRARDTTTVFQAQY